jgi:hypothetical protein
MTDKDKKVIDAVEYFTKLKEKNAPPKPVSTIHIIDQMLEVFAGHMKANEELKKR